jgi:valyl-tRNA synthetase
MSTDSTNLLLPKTYDFRATEEARYVWWEQRGYFKPTSENGRTPFVVSMPPPNVTGQLHLGHAMFVALEDLMIRYQRMCGRPVLWVPGSDHAGIATQLQVENHLLRTEEVTREELGREEFVRRTWEWKQKYGGIITQQIRRLGASCDWAYERFTLDEGLSKAVVEAFVRLHKQGLIYRGPRLINWSPGLKTAVSDLEVEYSEEPGTLYQFKYMLQGSDEFIPVATTRPETILADTAVAVHPDDPRYQKFIGRSALVPILGRVVPVIADDYVDREFGTGALKITPGHDANDYAIGQRHGLPIISILDREARVTGEGGLYAGLDRFEARTRLWADMRAAGLVIQEQAHTLNVPRSQRGGEIIEPMISTQWFVKIETLAAKALAAVRDGEIQIVPERFEKVYFNWLENIQDWCVSRQLWWGHRIPVWYAPDGSVFCAHSAAAATAQAEAHFGHSVTLEQDPDVLDTWFSSGLWPFSTLGWPDETADFKRFYPTSVLETGYDILFFWVARMIMLGLEFTGKAPFDTVYLHGLVRDEQGRKMSKTLGNVIDPLEVMDEFGTDALRFTLLTGSTPGNDTNLSLERVRANRNFANKIWNAARFVIGKLDSAATAPPAPPTLADRWILARLHATIADCTRQMESHQYGQAGSLAYEFIWNEYADWYIEAAKQQLDDPALAATTQHTLVAVLEQTLRLLHPFVPFVTEEIWQNLRAACARLSPAFQHAGAWPDALIIAAWPAANPASAAGTATAAADVAAFNHVIDLVRAIRNARAENKIDATLRLTAHVAGHGRSALLQSQSRVLAQLARLDETALVIQDDVAPAPAGYIALVVGTTEVYLQRPGAGNAADERARLEKELAELETQVARLEALLNGSFAGRAPAEVVERERAKLAEYHATRASLQGRLGAAL